MGMGPYVEYDYAAPATAAANGVVGFMLVFFLLFYLLMIGWSILNYVLFSLSLYKIAQRRGIHHPWLAWLPVGNVWVLGSISDQYQYLVKGNVRNKRKTLVGLNIAMYATLIPVFAGLLSTIYSAAAGSDASSTLVGATVALLLIAYLAMFVLAIIMAVFEYIALYDLFNSCDPGNSVLYLVLSIFVGVVLPFFLFACRNKDLGMPPRKQPVRPVYAAVAPAEQPAEPVEEPVAPVEEASAVETEE